MTELESFNLSWHHTCTQIFGMADLYRPSWIELTICDDEWARETACLWLAHDELEDLIHAKTARVVWSFEQSSRFGKGTNRTAALLWNVRADPVKTGLAIAMAFERNLHHRKRWSIAVLDGIGCECPPELESPWHHAMTDVLPRSIAHTYNDMFEGVVDREKLLRSRSREGRNMTWLCECALSDMILSLVGTHLVHVTFTS